MSKPKPNLFDWATSELSQDAMLCWLSAWANPSAAQRDPSLHKLGQKFLQLVFTKHNRRIPAAIKSIEIRRQHRNIDVLVVVNKTVAVCFEDKAGTTEHSDQLRRYIAALKDDGLSRDRILPVYVQTGEQGNYRAVRDAGFAVIGRSELIDLLSCYLREGGSNSIAHDFYHYLAGLEARIQAFHHLPPTDWDWHAWQGFYSALQQVLGDGDWGYVANRRGGFLGYWWHWHSDSDSEQYLQIEQETLCFKIHVKAPEKRAELRSRWNRELVAAADESLNVVRPRRLGAGRTMTVAVLDGDFRIANSLGCLDLAATVLLLRRAEGLLDRATAIRSRGMAATQTK